MIVQTAPEGKAHFVVFQPDHARLSGQFAAAFGNSEFFALNHRDPDPLSGANQRRIARF